MIGISPLQFVKNADIIFVVNSFNLIFFLIIFQFYLRVVYILCISKSGMNIAVDMNN